MFLFGEFSTQGCDIVRRDVFLCKKCLEMGEIAVRAVLAASLLSKARNVNVVSWRS